MWESPDFRQNTESVRKLEHLHQMLAAFAHRSKSEPCNKTGRVVSFLSLIFFFFLLAVPL